MPSTLTFPRGTKQGNTSCLNIVALADNVVEGDQSFLLSLVNATAGTTVGPITNTLVSIIDDG